MILEKDVVSRLCRAAHFDYCHWLIDSMKCPLYQSFEIDTLGWHSRVKLVMEIDAYPEEIEKARLKNAVPFHLARLSRPTTSGEGLVDT